MSRKKSFKNPRQDKKGGRPGAKHSCKSECTLLVARGKITFSCGVWSPSFICYFSWSIVVLFYILDIALMCLSTHCVITYAQQTTRLKCTIQCILSFIYYQQRYRISSSPSKDHLIYILLCLELLMCLSLV